VVFWHDPKSATTLYCWCLPHWSEFKNILENPHLYTPDQVADVKAHVNFDLYHFGFTKTSLGHWIPNENYKDKPMMAKKPALILA
jgi:hypothetical protein